MRTSFEDGTLTLFPEGHVDSRNANDFDRELQDALAAHPGAKVVIDAASLDYISSAGLRAIIRLMKQVGEGLTVTNVSPEVYEVFDMTGFTELMDVRRALREISVEGCEIVGKGGNGTVYRLDVDTIVKVYRPWVEFETIERERSFARTAFVNGVPSVIAFDVVRVGDCLGVVFEMIKSDTLGHAMAAVADDPQKLEELVDKYVGLARTLHTTHVAEGAFAEIHEVMHERADLLGELCTPEEVALLHSIIDDIPHTNTLTHNDLHPGNIMVQDGELLLIDMPEVTLAPPVCDLVSIYRDMISAPQGAAVELIEQSVGMPADLILKVGRMFFQKYTGITDSEQLEAYFKRLGLLYAFNVVFMAVAGGEGGRKHADAIMSNLLRPIVVPNEQAIRALFKSM